jgi:hypothetical protein
MVARKVGVQEMLHTYLHDKRRSITLEEGVFPIGSRICVVHDGPLRGRIGTILAIRMTATPGKPTFCVYLVALDDAVLLELQWFESQKVALLGTPCEKSAAC